MSLKYNGKLISFAKELRSSATPQEKHLWYDFLAKYPVRFQRQKTIDNFIADFYCYQAKLIIELDGSQHYTDEAQIYDNARSKILEKYGLQVLRFSNQEINDNFKNVCLKIDLIVKKRIAEQNPPL